MGRRDKAYKLDLHDQAYQKLNKMLQNGVGTSKHEDMRNGSTKDKIYSYATYQTYMRQCNYFCKWAEENYQCTTLKSAKQYVNEYLEYREKHGGKNGKPLSAWTLSTQRAALGKLYGIDRDDPNYYKPPTRNREDIIRSRRGDETTMAKHFSDKKHKDFTEFCEATGCRRNIIEKLEGRDLVSREEAESKIKILESKETLTNEERKQLHCYKEAVETFPNTAYFIYHRGDKGGRDRVAPVVGEHADKAIDKMKQCGLNEKVWPKDAIPSNCDVHGLRAKYAQEIYREIARPINTIPYDRINKGSGKKFQSEVYVCRNGGHKYDAKTLTALTRALGHNRKSVTIAYLDRG